MDEAGGPPGRRRALALGLFLVGGVLGLLARALIKRATPPVPEQAIREAQLTSAALKADGHG